MEQHVSTPTPTPVPSLLNKKEKFAYLLSGTGLQTVLMSIENFILYFYTNVMGISAAAAGTIGMIVSIWDGVNDPIVSNIVDNRTFKSGEKIRPLLKYFTIPMVVFFALMFIAPDMSVGMKFAWALVFRLLYETVCTAILIPFTSLCAIASPYPEDRVVLGQQFTIGSLIGTGIVTVAVWPLVALFGGIGGHEGIEAERVGFASTMCLFAVICAFCLLFYYRASRERIQHIDETKNAEKYSLLKTFKLLFPNKHFLLLNAFRITTSLSSAPVMACLAYYAQYVLGDTMWTIPVMVVFLVGCAVSTPFAKLLARRFTTKGIGIIGAAAFILSKIPFIFAPASIVCVLFNALLHGVGVSLHQVASSVNNAYLADMIEATTGKRIDATVAGLNGMIMKIISACVTLGIGLALEASHYDGMLDVQPASAIFVINGMIGWIPLIFSTLCLVVTLFINVEREATKLRNEALEKAE